MLLRRSPDGRLEEPAVRFEIPTVARKTAVVTALAVLFVGVMLLALSARNGYCLPWQERVGYGDGPLGESQDYSVCR